MDLRKWLGRGLVAIGLSLYASASPAPDCREAIEVAVYENSVNEYGHLITSRVGLRLQCLSNG
ncbi:MAG: hypothetical protein R3200_08855 [Xanthomonadales bacterium]|nr:hypothetical protein [Xanthomonadales bacterium]